MHSSDRKVKMGEAGGQHDVCKYNITGLCKHGENCFKYAGTDYVRYGTPKFAIIWH